MQIVNESASINKDFKLASNNSTEHFIKQL